MAGGQAGGVRSLSETGIAAAPSGRVRVLSPEVANQIAAGEVVERPASVVKELVENALDAGARRIVVELERAGSQLIAVMDDGEGMSPADAVTAFSRHATSKLTGVDDLLSIVTMGFRGEALASIAAVSHTTLATRRREDLSGAQVVVRHGAVREVTETACVAGTRVEVADLFGNTPARRKFLKTAATEVGHVNELVTRTALAWPEVAFVLRHGDRTLVELPAVDEHGERVLQVLGRERLGEVLRFETQGQGGEASGWLGHSHVTFPNARQIYTYVNRRYVRDKVVTHALLAGYSTLLMHGRYPSAVIFLDVPHADVDVNVHPAKSEVRFRCGNAVHELLSAGVQEALRQRGREPVTGPGEPPTPTPSRPPLRLIDVALGPSGSVPAGAGETTSVPAWPGTSLAARSGDRPVAERPSEAGAFRVAEPATGGDGFFASLRVLGQVFDGYLVCQGAERLVLIDQHAAHERVMFERLSAAYGEGDVPRQQVLVPAVVDVGPREAALLGEYAAQLEPLGFEIEPYGGQSFAVRAVPALLADHDPGALLRDLAQEIAQVGTSRRLEEAAQGVLATLACHSAVRVGNRLGAEQIHALLVAMDRADFSGHCPHGRPAFLLLTENDLERWFKRT